MMELGFGELCSKASNDTIEIIKCQKKDSDVRYYFDEKNNLIESDSEIDLFDDRNQNSDLVIVKLNLNTSTACCRLCNQLHPVNSENVPIDRRLSLLDSINNKTNSKLNSLTTINKTASFNLGHVYQQLDPIKNLIDNMKNFQSTSQNFESEIKKSNDLIRKRINNFFQNNLLKDLNENYSKLVKELEEFEKSCVSNVDKTSQFWKELENLINANKLDSETIQFYLNDELAEPNESTNNLIEDFSKLLDTKLKEFNSYIMMEKKVTFKLNPDYKIDQFSLGLLNCTQIQTVFKHQDNNLESNNQNLFHLNEIIEDKKTKLHYISELDLTKEIDLDENNFKYFSVYTLDFVDCLILCARYGNSSSNDLNTDFYLVNSDGFITKSLSINKSTVRCISTNSCHLLFTMEKNQNDLNKTFELNLYNSDLNLVKSLKVTDTNHLIEANSSQIFPISACLNEEKIFIFKNTIPFVNVYDMNLNLLTIFGQDINSSYKYFIKRTHNFMCIKSSFLYTSQVTVNGTTVTVLDLNTGLHLQEVEIENYFTNFYVLSQNKIKNEILFICYSSKKMVVYDLKSRKIVFSAMVCDETSLNGCITSYSLTKFGFLATILSNTPKIAVF
ncbi:hypothetical protein BpHYR1_009478 [Brachionus plicatilis]|uniref:Uncharacterized protein n=1 Tax=Brachionus plicatilis TaxID=10195 RepID=A0A3M7S0G2_BRAPC|nr:hypothetical protein BpHYR1_009478 [Brachionus plicatilis]